MMTNRFALDEFCVIFRRKGLMVLCLVLCTLGLSLSATAHETAIITFDAPGAGTAAGQGTTPIVINPAGVIAGFYVDPSNVVHSFLRSRAGDITTFDAPGAGTGAFQGTFAFSMNP